MKEVQELINFIAKSKSMFHAANEICEILSKNGFMGLNEAEYFNLKKGGKYFVRRNDGSVIAFKVPNNEQIKGFSLVASHLDSPSFKIKPNGKMIVSDYTLLNTEVYGGPILSTWFDRELGIAGRVFYKNNETIESKLIDLDESVVIPNIAIHLNRSVNNGYEFNPQVDTLPIFGCQEASDLKEIIATKLGINKEELLSSDLFLYPKETGKIIGANSEYFISPKIDNLECAYTSLQAFIKAENNEKVIVYASFNHEEVGSSSNHGAGSTFLEDTLRRIANSYNKDYEFYLMMLANSMIVSADNAHAVHHAAISKADPTNQVFMNKGIVIKNAANLSYTTDAKSASLFKKILIENKIPFQDYTNRSNLRGGGTLGSISLSHLSINSIDIGLAQLAMHSAVETAGCEDIEYMIKGLIAFYQN